MMNPEQYREQCRDTYYDAYNIYAVFVDIQEVRGGW